MKKSKLLSMIAAGVLTLSMGAFALSACGGSGTDYTFEAEKAVATGDGLQGGSTPGPATIAEDVAYKINGQLVEDATISGYENFNTAGQKLTWTVVSSSACKATLTLHAASAVMYFDMGTSSTGIAEIDFGTTEAYKLTCNGDEAKMSGKLAGAVWENGFEDMAAPGEWWNICTVTATINLKAGENEIVLEILSSVEGQSSAGINVDKIVINSSSELSEKS